MGAQAYTRDNSLAIYTTDASWLATKLCHAFQTIAERKEAYPEFAPGMADWTGNIAAETVRRTNRQLPIKYAEWRAGIENEKDKWKDRKGDVYGRCDWMSARRFISRCARRRKGFSLSF